MATPFGVEHWVATELLRPLTMYGWAEGFCGKVYHEGTGLLVPQSAGIGEWLAGSPFYMNV